MICTQCGNDRMGGMMLGGSFFCSVCVAPNDNDLNVRLYQRIAELETSLSAREQLVSETMAKKAELERELAEIKQEEIRRIRHLNRLATWAQQDPTGPICANGIQEWVLQEIQCALGAKITTQTVFQPSTAIIERLEKQNAELLESEAEHEMIVANLNKYVRKGEHSLREALRRIEVIGGSLSQPVLDTIALALTETPTNAAKALFGPTVKLLQPIIKEGTWPSYEQVEKELQRLERIMEK